ncbi:hypothetical protein T4B_2613 [Trichinella pseudospiralis]|uniref:Uncharacterized protein n=1 Tax=Trichinella pseudospiralis TaxID=6337 RepID=A0A0V1H1T7_TRIPS|nr:hypothetical protein T4B_2613 [Trichinella pseudospiralis]
MHLVYSSHNVNGKHARNMMSEPGAEMTRRLHISRPAVLMVEKVFVHFDHLKIKNTHQLMTQLNRDWAANADAADKQSDIPEQSANDNRLFGGRH